MVSRMTREILVLSLSRSGHHAIINWIAEQTPGYVFHHNNCTKGWEQGILKSETGRITTYQNGPESETHIYSIETFDMDDLPKIRQEFDQTLVIVRDPWNWIASCFKGGGEGRTQLTTPFLNERGEEKPGTIELWKKQVRACLGAHTFISVNFNDWTSRSTSYRFFLADRLGIPFTDEGREVMPPFGGGSSFTGMNFQGTASDMGVLERWKVLQFNEEYLSIISDPELNQLGRDYFQMECPHR